jgi:hypothetical protein
MLNMDHASNRTGASMLRIAIVDDHAWVRAGLREFFAHGGNDPPD